MDNPAIRSERNCLVMLLDDSITLATATWPLASLANGSRTYVMVQDHGGFYDWLRRADGELIGVRYWPGDPNDHLLAAASAYRYTRIVRGHELEIYFVSGETVAADRSRDQEFQYDAIYRASPSDWALAFDTAALRTADWECLKRRGLRCFDIRR
jgi:hypothetical protein